MDENFNPNRNVYGSSMMDGLGKASIDEAVTPRNTEAAADIDAPLIAALVSLEDGQVAVVGDLVAIRAGPDTYHPIKALKVKIIGVRARDVRSNCGPEKPLGLSTFPAHFPPLCTGTAATRYLVSGTGTHTRYSSTSTEVDHAQLQYHYSSSLFKLGTMPLHTSHAPNRRHRVLTSQNTGHYRVRGCMLH